MHEEHDHGCYDPASALFGMALARRFDWIDRKLDLLLARNTGDLSPEAKAAFQATLDRLNALSDPISPKE